MRNCLPDGLTFEDVEELIRQRENEKRREDYARHPERNIRQRKSAYANFLRRQGCLVMDNVPPAPPWTELQQRAILHAVEAAMKKGGAVNE